MPEVVASWDGGEITADELREVVGDELRRMQIAYEVERHEVLYRALQGTLGERLLVDAARQRDLPGVDALLRDEVYNKVEEPSEVSLQASFERFQETVPTATFESARPYLLKEHQRTATKERREAFEEEIRESLGLKVRLPFPDIPRVDVPVEGWHPSVGAEDAQVTIVEFGGYQCYYCKRMHDTVLELVDAWPDQVRLVYRNFPLAGHEHAHRAAYAAHCAHQQGRWRDMSGRLLDNQGQLDTPHLHRLAEGLDLDMDSWRSCMEDTGWSARIERDVHAGREAGVTSTPTFFVNGLMVVGAVEPRRFKAIVEQELSRAP